MSFCVLGTGSYVPPKVVTNDDLASFLVTSDEWIRERTGIRERHVCVEESACDLAYQAALAALDQSGVKAEELDMILCATISSDFATPSMSCVIQKRLAPPARRWISMRPAQDFCSCWILRRAFSPGTGWKRCW